MTQNRPVHGDDDEVADINAREDGENRVLSELQTSAGETAGRTQSRYPRLYALYGNIFN